MPKPTVPPMEDAESGAMKMYSFRSQPELIESLKVAARRRGTCYQRLMREVLQVFAEADLPEATPASRQRLVSLLAAESPPGREA